MMLPASAASATTGEEDWGRLGLRAGGAAAS